jgi:hypothetical protein
MQYFFTNKGGKEMNKLMVGAGVSLMMVGLGTYLVARNQKNKEEVETESEERPDFRNVLKMHKEASSEGDSKLSDAELNEMNEVSAQMGEAPQESAPIDPADLIDKPKKKKRVAEAEPETVEEKTEE